MNKASFITVGFTIMLMSCLTTGIARQTEKWGDQGDGYAYSPDGKNYTAFGSTYRLT